MIIKINPSRAHGTATAPPSKSQAHRLLLCSALSNGTSTVRGISYSDDILATLDCISSIGVPYEKTDDAVIFHGDERKRTDCPVFCCRESGSTMRFLIPISLTLGDCAVFTGSDRLIERGVGEYERIFRKKGIITEKTSDSITFRGHLTPGRYEIKGDISSQFVTGLLLSLPLLDGDSALCVVPPVESRPYIDITLNALRKFGISIIEAVPNTFYIPGRQGYRLCDLTVEGDWSNAAFLYALSSVGGDVTVTGLDENSAQGDRVSPSLLSALDKKEPVIDLSDCPDLAPVLFAVAAYKNGAVFTGTHRLKIKESDRAAAMAEELAKFGVRVDVSDDSVTVHGGGIRPPTSVLCSHNDHRIVMALSVLASTVGGVIDGAEAVNKSYPDFFKVLSSLGVDTEVVE